jgi:hypothetical protein
MLPAQGALGQQYFGRRKYYWGPDPSPYDAAMTATGSRLVATATAWAALGLAVFLAACSLPIDDFWLSLASAREIAGGADPGQAISLTWIPTIPGAINPQWGAQLIFGATGTIWGALAVNSALIVIGLLVTLARTRRRASSTAASIAMLLMVGALAPHLLARAQSFSICLLPVALLLLERRPAPRWLPLGFGILMVAWANLHGAFVIGQLAALAALLGELMRTRRGQPAAPLLLGGTALVSLLAPLVNPAGLGLLAYAYGQPGLDVVRSISIEWQPAWPWIPVATVFWAYLGLFAVARVLRRGGLGAGDGILAIALGLFAAYSIRQIPWFLLATAPVLAADVDALFRARPRMASAVGKVSGPLETRARACLAVALVAVIAFQPLRGSLPESIGRVTLNEPVALATLLEAALHPGSHERLLNEQVWGGYLSYRLGDRVETAMDGRLEIRSRASWVAYFGLMHGDGDPAAELASNDVAWAALSPERTDLLADLVDAGWTIELEGTDQVLLHRR